MNQEQKDKFLARLRHPKSLQARGTVCQDVFKDQSRQPMCVLGHLQYALMGRISFDAPHYADFAEDLIGQMHVIRLRNLNDFHDWSLPDLADYVEKNIYVSRA